MKYNETMQKILIVEDDTVISEQLAKKLSVWGYDVHVVQDFQHVDVEFQQYAPHLVLLDIQLPFYNGYYWCNEIRKVSQVPITFISSASDNMNQIMAMNMGGDDFIAKPFQVDVLIAKIQALLRRAYQIHADVIEHNGLLLNTDDYSIHYGDKQCVLTRNEYRILYILMKNPGHIMSRDVLMQKLWNTDEFVDDNTLTVNITRLRKKIESIGLKDYIITRKGSGYIV